MALPLRDVVIDDGFWAPRREIVRTATIPQQHHQLRTGGQLEALRSSWQPGHPEPHIFWESDVGKWIEAASYSLVRHPDAQLEALTDEVVRLLQHAQQPDGYLNVYFTAVRPGQRFTDLRDAHELYCLGHLIEGAVARVEATGKRDLLDVVCRYADLVEREFGPGGAAEGGYDGHEEIELALIKLTHATGQPRYRDLAARMVDARGAQPFYYDAETESRGDEGYFGRVFPQRPREGQRFREYNQSHRPVREQHEAVGHSVRAMYLYCAMTDLAVELDDDGLMDALRSLWRSVTDRKMYLTGGIGSDHSIEGFGNDYELDNATNYNETCASIGLVMWAHRMALATGHARYLDVLETALYNTVLAGASLDGTHYFYGNPMESAGTHQRAEWFGVACCPPNLARLLTSLERYVYAAGPRTAMINLFVAGAARFSLEAGEVALDVHTDYPWDGRVAVRVDSSAKFELALRIPGWADEVTASLNGTPITVSAPNGFLGVDREWTPGDLLVLDVSMPARRVWANPAVADCVGKVAVVRGPLVYCIESADNEADPAGVVLPRDAVFAATAHPNLPVVMLESTALAVRPRVPERLYDDIAPEPASTTIRAIPYFAWANRGVSSMTVWLHDEVCTQSREPKLDPHSRTRSVD